ncbi:MAG: dTMP kinase [Ignavibacteriae bacterium]|nr:dTMP kinase [Ignavibacteria bacterium]MBI3363847.1 dTMP kinase [Ignavibacteriota bacterium]
MRGRLIIFEGLDGAGKTTQIELLSRYLQDKGQPVVITRWNSSRLISKAIKRAKKAQLLTPYLFSTLHAADFMYRLENIIIPSLYEGNFVIADRYVYTALARDVARNVDRSWVEHLYALAPKPDLAFYCKTSIEETLERIVERRDGDSPSFYESGMDVIQNNDPHEAFREFQSRIASEYDWICKHHGLIEIDTGRQIEDIHSFVVPILDDSMKKWSDEAESSPVASPSFVRRTEQSPARQSLMKLFEANLSPHSYPGKLIVIEGADKHATARQANLLYNDLLVKGYDVRLGLAGDSWVGMEVERKVLKKSVLSLSTKVLLAASEAVLTYEQVILPALQSGDIVILDGYLANLATRYCASGLSPEWFEPMTKVFTIQPDVTIFLDTTLHDLMKKRKAPVHLEKFLQTALFGLSEEEREESIDLTMLQRVVDLYRECMSLRGWLRVPYVGSPKELHQRMWSALADTLHNVPHHTANESLREILHVLSHFDESFLHERKVAELATSLFDQTTALHTYGDRERSLLYYASLLHDVGHALSDKKHDEFTYEAIMRQEFSTISGREKEVIANIACLHRLPYNKISFGHLARLQATDQIIVKRLASLLRIADALDESGRRIVRDVRCYDEHGVIFIDLHAVSKALPERAAVLRKADMFEQVYQKPVVVARNWIEKRARRAKKVSQSHG